MTLTKPKWLLFDLGGVLMHFDGVPRLSEVLGLSEEQTHAAFIASPSIEALETGRMDALEFAQAFASEVNLDLPPPAMLDLWADLENGPIAGAFDLLSELRTKWPIACLSNTSAVHWERACRRYDVHEYFDRLFLSYEVGLHKPDPKIFDHVAETLGVENAAITYFDDRADIVESARSIGFDAHQVRGPEDIRAILKAHIAV